VRLPYGSDWVKSSQAVESGTFPGRVGCNGRSNVAAPETGAVRVLALVACLFLYFNLIGAEYYVAPSGNDTNAGSLAAPFYTIAKAVPLAHSGDTIWVRGGTYFYTNTITITNSGAPNALIRLWAYGAEHPVLDFSAMADADPNRGFLLKTNQSWWHFKGLEIYRAGDNGMKVEGSCNIIEMCSFHHNRDTGLQMGLADGDENDGTVMASNLVLNCDSYLNYDPRHSGGNADGFACKLSPGQSNVFRGCRSWENSDDGWDLFKSNFQIVLEDCWTFHNGDPASFGVSSVGNAGGFKLGGDSSFGAPNIVRRCIAFNNHYGGSSAGRAFHQNDNTRGLTLYNCLSFSNNYNYALNNDIGESHVMKNCVGFAGVTKNVSTNSTTIQVNNSWNLPSVTPNPADYLNLDENLAKAPRNADGSLPNNGFARLVSASDLIDKGVKVGLPFSGSAPDLGAFEFVPGPVLFDTTRCGWTNGGFQLALSGLSGHGPVVLHASSNMTSWSPFLTNPPVSGTLQLLDSSASNHSRRYYRAEEK